MQTATRPAATKITERAAATATQKNTMAAARLPKWPFHASSREPNSDKTGTSKIIVKGKSRIIETHYNHVRHNNNMSKIMKFHSHSRSYFSMCKLGHTKTAKTFHTASWKTKLRCCKQIFRQSLLYSTNLPYFNTTFLNWPPQLHSLKKSKLQATLAMSYQPAKKQLRETTHGSKTATTFRPSSDYLHCWRTAHIR